MPPSSTRRRFLRTATALVSTTAVAGCSQFTPSETTTTTTSGTTTRTTTEPRARISLTRETYLAKAWTTPQDRFRFPKGDSVPLTELNEAVREVVRTAIESPPYTTQEASEALRDHLDDVHLVTFEGTVWAVEHTFPTVTIRLDTDISGTESVKERTVASDSEVVQSNDAISDVVWTIAPHGTETEPRPYETARLDPAVQAFLDTYDYIETPRGVGEIVISRTNRTPPHTVRAREATDEELYGRRIREAADYGPPTRDLIERLLASDRKTPGHYQDRIHTLYPDDIPRAFARDLDHGSSYVRVNEAVYGFDTRHVHWDELPLELHASVLGDNTASEDPIDIQLSVQNSGGATVELSMAGLAPFGVLWAYGPGGEYVLWNDAYEQTDKVLLQNDTIIPERTAERALPPAQSHSATYRLGHDYLGPPLESGTYEVFGTLWANWPPYESAKKYDWRSQLFPYTLTITVT